jgi:SAM-dependent methyltransferase
MVKSNIEYLNRFRQLEADEGEDSVFRMLKERRALCRQYSFAIPSDEAIDALVGISPLVELGAGTGYWAMLITQRGGQVIAVDKNPGEGNKYQFTHSYAKVREGGVEVLGAIGDHLNLFLCWPNYDNDFAYNCLRSFRGKIVAYAGEPEGGCTANDRFFELLRREWSLLDKLALPQWFGINDGLFFYARKAGMDARDLSQDVP